MKREQQEAARVQFGRQAGRYAQSKAHSEAESLAVMTRLASDRQYDLALDVATGPGFTAFAVAPYCQQLLATDIAPGMLREAARLRSQRAIANVDLAYAAVEALPFQDGAFDLVTCRTAPHHFADVSQAMREMARVLARGGVLLMADTCTPDDPDVSEWHQEVEGRRDPSHVRNLSVAEWLGQFSAAGLEVDFTTETRVELDLARWTSTSGTNSEETARLRRDWGSAPAAVVDAFRIVPLKDGNFGFSWPCLVARATRP